MDFGWLSCQCNFINDNKRPSLVSDIDNGGSCDFAGAGGISVPPFQLYYKPKIDFKKVLIFFLILW